MQSAECKVQSYGRFSLRAKIHNYLNFHLFIRRIKLKSNAENRQRRFSSSTLHSAFCTLHSALCILHFAFCTLHFTLCTNSPKKERHRASPFCIQIQISSSLLISSAKRISTNLEYPSVSSFCFWKPTFLFIF